MIISRFYTKNIAEIGTKTLWLYLAITPTEILHTKDFLQTPFEQPGKCSRTTIAIALSGNLPTNKTTHMPPHKCPQKVVSSIDLLQPLTTRKFMSTHNLQMQPTNAKQWGQRLTTIFNLEGSPSNNK